MKRVLKHTKKEKKTVAVSRCVLTRKLCTLREVHHHGSEILQRSSLSSIVVFFGRVLSGVLVTSFLLSPIADVHAADSATTTPVVEASSNSATSTEPTPSVVPSIESTPATVSTTTNDSTVVATTTLPAIILDQQGPTTTALGTSDANAPTTTPVVSNASDSVTPVVDTVATTTTDVTASTTSQTTQQPEVSTSTTPTTVVATTTPDVATTSPVPVVATSTNPGELVMTHTTDANRYTFSTNECIPLGNGTFHCVKHDGASEKQNKAYGIGDVYSAPDAGGDTEIFEVGTDGIAKQITHNNDDDNSPSKDSVTGDIVWHTLHNDRFQIMHYDTASGNIDALTDETYNNMEPSSYNGVVVWQAWKNNEKGGGWQIMMKDGAETTQLTTAVAQNILPSIDADYISWQSDEGGVWSVKIYNRKTKHIDTVNGVAGGKVENPRMVLIFDNKKENGDVETVGFDPVKGKAVSLGSSPVVPLPKDIPVPEPQKNDKALIVAPQAPRTETKSTTTPDGVSGGTDPNLTPQTGTSTPTQIASTTPDTVASSTPIVGDIDMTVGSSSASTTPPVIVPVTIATTTATDTLDVSHIDELVVPSYTAASTTVSQ